MSTATWEAKCQCGAVTVLCEGAPLRTSVCHCLDCQKRSGSAFATQARYRKDSVTIRGGLKLYVRVADSGTEMLQYFCPHCGTGVYYQGTDEPDMLAVAVGLFSDPMFPAPQHSVYERSKHPWVAILGPAKHRSE